MVALVRAAALGGYAAVARRVGLQPEAMIRAARLNPVFLSDPDLRIPTLAVVSLLEASARRAGCETFGLQMAETWRLSDFGALSLLLAQERTLRDALAAVIGYRHLLNDSVSITVEDAGAIVIVRGELVAEGTAGSRQGIELAMGVIFRLFRALLGPQWKPLAVRFTHAPPADLSIHRRLFRTVEFNAEFNGIVCPTADLDRAIPSADATMAHYARGFIDSLPGARGHSIALEVRKSIYTLLPGGRATLEQIAYGLGMSERGLQRALDESGESFSQILNHVRRELVLRYLENPAHSLTQVAQLLGYAFPSSFTRWFTAQFGMSPARWRVERLRARAKVRR